jgi:hypothetical protein
MKPLKELTLPWIERVCGVFFKNAEAHETTKVMFRLDAKHFEEIEVVPVYPECKTKIISFKTPLIIIICSF